MSIEENAVSGELLRREGQLSDILCSFQVDALVFLIACFNSSVIFSSETFLMHDPLKDDDESLAMVTSLHVHELVHQWFGNLVTPAWWTDEWLSEGVTTYISNLVIQEVRGRFAREIIMLVVVF